MAGWTLREKNIFELARSPNVVCKISDVLAYCAPGTASEKTIQPYIDHVINVFGADRLVWGSDWPVIDLANGLQDWLEGTRAVLSHMSTEEAEKLANRTASRIYAASIR